MEVKREDDRFRRAKAGSTLRRKMGYPFMRRFSAGLPADKYPPKSSLSVAKKFPE